MFACSLLNCSYLFFYAVPQHLLGMQFELGPRVGMSPALLQSMNTVWTTYDCSYPLYVAKLNRTHVVSGEFVCSFIYCFC